MRYYIKSVHKNNECDMNLLFSFHLFNFVTCSLPSQSYRILGYYPTQALADGNAGLVDATNVKKYNSMHSHMNDDFTKENKQPNPVAETSIEKDKGTYIGLEDSSTDEEDQQLYNNDDDDLNDIWQEMTFAMESCKVLP